MELVSLQALPSPTDARIIDVLNGAVGFLREAGLVGMLLGFLGALYTGRLVFGRDHDALKRENVELKLTVDRLARILERSTVGLERVTRRRTEGASDEVDLPPADWARPGRREHRRSEESEYEGG